MVSIFRLFLLAIVLAVSAVASAAQPRYPFAFSLNSYAVGPAFGFRERFFTETGGGDGLGFSLSDYMDGPQFLAAFERLGGEQVLGYPVSRPFVEEDGLVYQLTQRALLQWFPDESLVRLANLYQILEEAGLDDALFEQFIPKPLPDDASSYNEAKATRLGWLTHDAIRDAYLQNPLVPGDVSVSIELYGLPMSMPEEFGPFIAQRFQRIAFQYWTRDVPGGQPAGLVVPINGGDILKEYIYAGTEIASPHLAGEIDIVGNPTTIAPPYANDAALPDGYNVRDVQILRGIKVLEPLASARAGLEAARVLQTLIVFRDLPRQVLGSFSSSNTIDLASQLKSQDVRALAVVLLHELVHLADWRSGTISSDYKACLQAEERAITAEAAAWGSLVGPDGKRPALTRLERLENARLDLLQGIGGTIFDHAEKSLQRDLRCLGAAAIDRARRESAPGSPMTIRTVA